MRVSSSPLVRIALGVVAALCAASMASATPPGDLDLTFGNGGRVVTDFLGEDHARAVVVPDASMAQAARTQMCDQLRAVGFSEVTMLSKPCQASDTVEPGPRVVAA